MFDLCEAFICYESEKYYKKEKHYVRINSSG